MVVPGSAAVGRGRVWHRRNRPTVHQFEYDVNHIWIDPDRPEELFDRHRLWSCRRPCPIRFRRADYFDGSTDPIGPAIRAALAVPLGREPQGPIRMLTQPRTWGWLFNPITVYLVWDDPVWDDPPGPPEPAAQPIGAVLEVTNTPWKERLTYPVALRPDGDRLTAEFDKILHVSPFLDENHTYRLTVSADTEPGHVELSLDVHPWSTCRPADDSPVAIRSSPIVETSLRLALLEPTAQNMTAALYRNPLPTHRVSLGIHLQAARLLGKRVPFVPHPKHRSEVTS